MVTTKKKKMISVITPSYNEEESIEACILRIREVFENHLPSYDYEHIICDNCSSDRTTQIIKEFAQKDKRIKLVVNARNFGVFKSMFNGLKRSSGEAIIPLLPVDLQDPPELIPEFVSLWENGYDIVAGARTVRKEPWLMQKTRALFYRILNFISDFEIPEKVGEFQLIDRKVANSVLQYKDRYPFLRSLIASVGFKRIIVPYVWKKRAHGKSRMNLFILIDQALNGFFSFSTFPLRVIFIVGTLVFAICLAYCVLLLGLYVTGNFFAEPGIPTILLAIFFFSGIQLMSVGILGEYVHSIHRQSRGGPVVFEKETVNFVGDNHN